MHIRRVLLSLFISAVLVVSGLSVSVLAYDEVSDISITVGYWGDTDYTKAEVSLSELASACGTYQQVYTWINQGNNPGTTEAEGIYLDSILAYCGIDSGYVYYYNFQSTDAATYAYSNQQWTNDQLMNGRYTFRSCFETAIADFNGDRQDYLRNPERHYTIDDFFDFNDHKYKNEAWNQREEAYPMLALKTKSSSWNGYSPASALDFSGLQTNGKPILMFGQAGKNDITRNLMVQMVKKICIWYSGSPQIELKAEDTEGKVGDQKQAVLSVWTPDDFLTEQIAGQVELRTSNGSVAEVAQDGTVTIKGEGTADITAVYRDKTYGSVTVTGQGEEDPKDPEDGSGEGSGSSEGDGDGSSKGDGDKDGSGEGSGSKSSGSGDSDSSSKGSKVSDNGSRTSLSANTASTQAAARKTGQAARAQKQGSAGGAASGSGDDHVKIYQISAADDVYVESRISPAVSRWLWAGGGASVGLGLLIEGLYFRGQIAWTRRAKRMFEKL